MNKKRILPALLTTALLSLGLVVVTTNSNTTVVSAAEETATISFANKAQRTTFTTSQQVWQQNGITVTNNKASSTNSVADYAAPARFYAGSNLVVEMDSTIEKIVFDCNSSSYATAMKNSIGSTATVSSDKVTVVVGGTNSFTVAKFTAQVRMDSITVTYSTGTESTEPVQLAAPSIEVAYDGTATWGAVVHATEYKYIINDGEPQTTTSTQVKLNEGETIKVQAIGDGEKYLDGEWTTEKTYNRSDY